MSCKGLVELIVLKIGLQARILSTRTFTMFVVMALVTTFATTPLVSFLYPPAYQRKLELWKAGKIDWEGNPLHTEDDDEMDIEKKIDVADRLLVYLRADGLSSLFSLVNLFSSVGLRPPPRPATHLTPIPEKGLFTTDLRHSLDDTAASSDQPSLRKRLRIHSLRLTELNERTSSVMRVSEPHEEYAGNDPIRKAFGYALKLALQLAQNPSVILSITKLTATERLTPDLVHQNDTAFGDLRIHGASLAANKVNYNSLDAATLTDNTFNESGYSSLFIIGRSVVDEGELVRVSTGGTVRTLGTRASEVIGRIKSGSLSAGVLVVQARDEGSGLTGTVKSS